MGRLPIPGQDDGTWGNILNDYLNAAHKSDGTLKDNAVDTTTIQNATISEDKLDTALAAKVNMAASGVVPDATTLIKGIVRLQGDLSGTADTPTVPGLVTKEPIVTAGATSQYYRGDKSWQTLDKTAVGLGNVDNTSDASKPISSAAQTALNAKANDNAVVHLTGNETVSGVKNFSGTLQASGSAVVTTDDSRLTDQRAPLNASVTPAKLVADAPSSGEVLSYNGTGFEWVAAGVGGGDPTMGGDISGVASNAQIVAGVVGATELATNAVTTIKVTDNNITEPKLAVSNSPSSSQVLSWNGSAMEWAAPATGAGGPGSTGYILVASNDAPAAVKAYADFVCDGTADQDQINSAIDLAAALQSRNPDMPAGAKQYGKVILTGGRFNISSGILMRTAVHLSGAGWLTELRSAGCNTAGLIMLADPKDHLCKVSDLYLNGGSGGGGTCSAIDFDMTGSNNLTGGYPDTNKDSYHMITDLFIDEFRGTGRHGIYLHATGTANNRGNIIDRIQIRDCTGGNGIYLSAASDSYISNCHVGGSGDAGYRIATGNTKINNCKSFYSVGYGFYFSSGRGVITGCESQDDQVGYMFDGSPYVASGLIADSSGTSGIHISTDRLVLTGFSIFNRGGTIEFPTTQRGLYFDGTYADLMIVGQTDNSNITTPIQGTPGTRSFMRVSDGTSLVTVGT